MDDTQKQREFKQALSALLELLPESNRVNTALFLKNNQPTTLNALINFLANKCEIRATRVRRLFFDRLEHVRTVGHFLQHEQEIVQRTTEGELQSWKNSLTNKKG